VSQTLPSPSENPGDLYVCADCFHTQSSMDRPCDKCRSVRVVLRSVVEALLGRATPKG
jgi:hypothetical protein